MLIGVFLLGTVSGGWLLSRLPGGESAVTIAPEGATAPRRILYYRNPMGAADISPVPKKDSMGMDYIPVYADEARASGLVRVDPAVAHNLGLRTARVERAQPERLLETVGFVQFDESRVTHVHTRVEGWIRRLHAHTEGQRVRAGEPLLTLFSPTLMAAQGEFLAALAMGNAAAAASAESRLRALDFPAPLVKQLRSTRQSIEEVPISASRDGYVSQLAVREGMYVTPEPELMTVGDIEHVWIRAELFERELSLVSTGVPVEIRARALPGRSWHGSVDYVYPVLDPELRTAQVRIVVPNADEALKPQLAVDLELRLRAPTSTLLVPRDALIRGARGDRVVRRLGATGFEAVSVRAGVEYGDRVEVLEGLAEGEEVVVSAQFLIDSESSIAAELQRLESATKASPELHAPGASPTKSMPEHHDHGGQPAESMPEHDDHGGSPAEPLSGHHEHGGAPTESAPGKSAHSGEHP
jgi:Cu(I)/Ag(I) efflux system membrane fusion protein